MQTFYTALSRTFWHINFSSKSLYFVRCCMYLEVSPAFKHIHMHLSSYYCSFLRHCCHLQAGKLLHCTLHTCSYSFFNQSSVREDEGSTFRGQALEERSNKLQFGFFCFVSSLVCWCKFPVEVCLFSWKYLK